MLPTNNDMPHTVVLAVSVGFDFRIIHVFGSWCPVHATLPDLSRVWAAGPAHGHGAGGAAHRQRRGAGRLQLLGARGAAQFQQLLLHAVRLCLGALAHEPACALVEERESRPGQAASAPVAPSKWYALRSAGKIAESWL